MNRLADPVGFFQTLPAGTQLVLHSGCAEPERLAGALTEAAPQMKGARLFTLMPMGPTPYAAERRAAGLQTSTFFPGTGLRAAINAGLAQPLRQPLSQIPGMFEAGAIRADVLLLQLSPPDADGNFSLGVSVDYMQSVLAQSPMVIAEINPHMPRTRGDTLVRASQVQWYVEGSARLRAVHGIAADPVDQTIAANVASLVGDAAVLQIGIGALPDRVLSQFGHLRHLGIHTGVFTDAMRPLIESGVIDNSRKSAFRGVSLATMAAGTQRLYDFLHENPAVEFHPCGFTHDRAVLASVQNLTAINSALQVDLAGNVNAELVRGRRVSMPGGLPDFAAGASRAEGGKSIIALRATHGAGGESNIVVGFPTEACTVPASDVDFVVTEHGVADLRQRSRVVRAGALIGVAHPSHREALERAFSLQVPSDTVA